VEHNFRAGTLEHWLALTKGHEDIKSVDDIYRKAYDEAFVRLHSLPPSHRTWEGVLGRTLSVEAIWSKANEEQLEVGYVADVE